MKVFFEYLTFSALLVAVANLASAQNRTPSPEELKLQLEIKRQEIRQPLLDLKAKYDQALERLEKSEQAKGNLAGVIEIQEERKQFANRTEASSKATKISKLAELRRVYPI